MNKNEDILEEQKENNSESLQKQLEACSKEQAEWKERALRLSADLENYKRRMEKEQGHWMQRAQATLLEGLLPIVDNFDRAVAHAQDNEGISMIHNELQAYLEKAGVKEVACDQFDPTYHEALMQIESEDKESGQIVEVLQKGYQLGEHVLRPAKVSVAK